MRFLLWRRLVFCLVASSGWAIHAGAHSGSLSPEVVAIKVTVIPVVFLGKGKSGDYSWMRKQAGYERAYFVFNDNERQFLAHQEDPNSVEGCSPGGGNGAARPWQCETPPRAGGVPTGTDTNGGYPALTPEVKAIIDRAVAAIKSNVNKYSFDKVIYSTCLKGSSPNCTLDDDLGTGIFAPSEDVRGYIVTTLKNIFP
jgi:hypothetical protein